MNNKNTALDLTACGVSIFPCDWRQGESWKSPLTENGFYDATIDQKIINNWWGKYPDALIGIPIKSLGALLVDVDNHPGGPNGGEAWQKLLNDYASGEVPNFGFGQITPRKGLHMLFNRPEDLHIPGSLVDGIDLKVNGYLCTGEGYDILGGHNWDNKLPNPPEWLLMLIEQKNRKEEADKKAWSASNTIPPDLVDLDRAARYYLEKYLREVRPRTNEAGRNKCGFNLAGQLRDLGLSKAQAEYFIFEYAAHVPQLAGDFYTEKAALASLKSAYNGARREPAIPAPARKAEKQSAEGPAADPQPIPPMPETPPPAGTLPGRQVEAGIKTEVVEFTTGQQLSDLGNAERLVILHGADLHYIPENDAFFVWNGTRFVEDKNGEADRRAESTAKSILIEAHNEPDKDKSKDLASWALKSQNHGRLNAMLDRAKSQPGITIPITQFDSDPFKLNFLNGTLDLRSGSMRTHNPIELLSKQIQLNYDPKATCPLWLKFLDEIMDHGQELISYLRRCIGYSLTGDTSEQCLFVGYGKGANGKTVYTRTILGAMGGDYAINARAEAILARDRHAGATPDLARLRGARFVAINEIPSYARLDEARVKEMTGNDSVTARFLFADEFSFIPAFKLWISTNHKPVIKDVDEGIWRRMRLIPFTVTIPEEKQDAKLLQKLQAEWPGIIAWAVQGCLEWQAGGLQTPEAVRKATAAYRSEEDTLQPFFEDKCILQKDAKAGATDLYKAYKTWCEDAEEKPAMQTKFGRMMTDRGFEKKNDGTKIVYFAIGLKND